MIGERKPIIFRATAQWFASIEAFRKELIEAVAETKWVPMGRNSSS